MTIAPLVCAGAAACWTGAQHAAPVVPKAAPTPEAVEQCMAARHAFFERARMIDDPEERVREYERAPDCTVANAAPPPGEASPSSPPSPPPPSPRAGQYLELGVLIGSEYGSSWAGAQITYGRNIARSPLWVRVGLAIDASTGAIAGGAFDRIGAGFELRGACPRDNMRVCLVAGVDLARLDLNYPAGAGGVHDAVLVPRIGLDIGSPELRFRPGVEVVVDSSGALGLNLTLAFAWQRPPAERGDGLERAARPPPRPRFEPSTTAKSWLGVQLEAVPTGTLDVDVGGAVASKPQELAYGVGGSFERWLTPNIAVGVAPRLVTPIQIRGVSGTGHELDLRARIAVGGELARRVFAHAVFTGGYAWLFGAVARMDPATGATSVATTSNLIAGAGVRVSYALNSHLLFVTELAYQWGGEGRASLVSPAPIAVGLSDRFLTLGFGVATALD